MLRITIRSSLRASWNRGERLVYGLALAIFLVSGFAALLYQVIWQRMLGMFSGVDMYSVTIIVAAYMAGLGCGSLAGGHLADRLSRRANLLLFAGSELGIAVFALASKALYYDTLYLQFSGLARSPAMLTFTLFVSLLWPTFLMGMSLPLLARALTREITLAAGTVGALYGVNTLGAAAGSLLTNLVLMRRYSFATSLQLGAALNFTAALCVALLAAYFWNRQPSVATCGTVSAPGDQPASDSAGPEIGPHLPVWLAVYGLSGFVALSLEMVWFRLLGTMLKFASFTFGTLLAVYLAGLAIGSLLGVPLVRRSRKPGQVFFALQTGIGLYASLSLMVLVAVLDDGPSLAFLWRYLGDYEPIDVAAAARALWQSLFGIGAVEGLTRELASRFLALYLVLPVFLMAPPTVMMGLSFPYLQKVLQNDAAYLGRRVGWLQSTNIGGCVLGTVLTSWVFLDRLGTAGTARLLLALTGVFLVLWVRARAGGLRSWHRAAGACMTALVIIGILIPNASNLWSKLHGTRPDRILFAEDGSGLALLKSTEADMGGTVTLFVNGRGESWIPYGEIHTILGALPALLHPRPERIAVIGLGSGDTLYHLAARPETRELYAIEIVSSQVPVLRELAVRRDYPALSFILSDPRVRHVAADGRIFIMQHGQKYDIIEADALRPTSAYSGNLYSEEYYRLLRGYLAEGGIAVTWSPTVRVRDTFIKVFPYVIRFGGVLLVGSNEFIPLDVDAINRRMAHPFTREHFERSRVDVRGTVANFLREHLPAFYSPEYDRSSLGDVNYDLFPKDEYMVSLESDRYAKLVADGKLAQSFLLDTDREAGLWELRMKRTGGPFKDSAAVRLLVVNDSPGGPDLNSIIAKSAQVPCQSVPADPEGGWVRFEFPSPPRLAARTKYWLVLEPVPGTENGTYGREYSAGALNVGLALSTPGSLYAHGECASYDPAPGMPHKRTWNLDTDQDVIFRNPAVPVHAHP